MIPTTQPSDTHEDASGSSSPTRDIALVAAFAALISASAYVGAIPLGSAGVRITLQTLTVMLAGCVLGPVRGFSAVALYLALGALGLPVFAEHSSGVGVFSGPSGGYLSVPDGRSARRLPCDVRRARPAYAGAGGLRCSITASILVIHVLGVLGMKLYFDVSLREAITYDMPFWIGDLVKTSLVAMIAAEVHRAFPQLLHRD